MTNSDALQFSRTASKLYRRIREIQEDTLEGDDSTPQIMEAILEAFGVVESMVEERYKVQLKTPGVEEIGDQ